MVRIGARAQIFDAVGVQVRSVPFTPGKVKGGVKVQREASPRPPEPPDRRPIGRDHVTEIV